MIVLSLLLVVCIIAAIYGFIELIDWLAILAGLGAVASGFALCAAIAVRLSFPADMRQAREIRTAVSQLGCNASEDVMGSALEFNRSITAAKYWRTRWYAQPFYAVGVDTVTLIEIPQCR